MKISIGFRWFDLWVGLYIDRHNRAVYVCPVPTLVIKLQFKKPQPVYIATETLSVMCRDCQHILGYHALSGECTVCNCDRFVQPDNP